MHFQICACLPFQVTGVTDSSNIMYLAKVNDDVDSSRSGNVLKFVLHEKGLLSWLL